MIPQPRFAHVNLIAKNCDRLARFYMLVFGCIPVPPERSLSGRWLDEATGIRNAQIRGVHLRLPGYRNDGPTLEIFQYGHTKDRPPVTPDRPGLGHIAFAVPDVAQARNAVLAEGGRQIGKLVSTEIAGAGSLTFVYVTDPEGNIIELQSWQ